MSSRTAITILHAMARWKLNIINLLLGPVARAGQLVLDADARLIGLGRRPVVARRPDPRPFFNQLPVITSR